LSATGSAHRLQEFLYVLLRFASGFCLACHGAQKLFGLLGGPRLPVGGQLWFGGIIELACGLGIALGLSRWAAFLASGTMAVAYVQFHWQLHLGARLLPVVNKGELALVYSLLFAYFAARGAGSRKLGKGR
jgi:putative oxidoreductase